MNLNEVAPRGRSYEEYVRVFNITPQNLNGKILHCVGGSANFNAEATQKGCRIISSDPLYRFSVEEIASRTDETYKTTVDGARANQDRYV